MANIIQSKEEIKDKLILFKYMLIFFIKKSQIQKYIDYFT